MIKLYFLKYHNLYEILTHEFHLHPRTDTFSVTGGGGSDSPPTICGTNTGEHSKIYTELD